jgi:hypothetical protein
MVKRIVYIDARLAREFERMQYFPRYLSVEKIVGIKPLKARRKGKVLYLLDLA